VVGLNVLHQQGKNLEWIETSWDTIIILMSFPKLATKQMARHVMWQGYVAYYVILQVQCMRSGDFASKGGKYKEVMAWPYVVC
jgi:hypothetical protein